ncbi:hypothetical protein [Streptomyces werraensis]|uniref:hypothetical protein n=1 Tax=Streptomyces werraensis TaxID=68284 RepID=UPI001CE2AAF0
MDRPKGLVCSGPGGWTLVLFDLQELLMTSIGSHRRKCGWLAVVAGVAVFATGTGVAVASSVGTSSVPAAPAVSLQASSTADAVQVVSPGQRIVVAGNTLWLTETGLHVVAPKSSGTDTPDVLRVADVLPGKVSTTARGDASGVLWSGLYRGPVTSTTKVTIKLGDRTLQAKSVTLSGKPGWGAFYVFDANGTADVKPSITIQS